MEEFRLVARVFLPVCRASPGEVSRAPPAMVQAGVYQVSGLEGLYSWADYILAV